MTLRLISGSAVYHGPMSQRLRRSINGLFLATVFFLGEVGFGGLDAVLFHGGSAAHSPGANVESAVGVATHADHCMLGFTPSSAQSTLPVAQATRECITRVVRRIASSSHITARAPIGRQPPSRAPPSPV